MTITPDYGPAPSVRARWRRGARIRAVKRYASKFIASFKEGLGSVSAAVGVFRTHRKPRRVVDMSPEQKVIFMALLSGDGRR